MKTLLAFVKATIVGGFLFLVPVGMVLVVFGRLYGHARVAAQSIHDVLLPSVKGPVLPFLLAILILLVIAFLAGVFLRTDLGHRLFRLLEDRVLARVPIYMLARQMIGDMTGGTVSMADGEGTRVVLVQLDDMAVLGFLIERGTQGQAVVYLPGAPSALSGSVALVSEDRITMTDLTPRDVVTRMRRLGAGLVALERAAFGKGGRKGAAPLADSPRPGGTE